jgi:hypothetical protein
VYGYTDTVIVREMTRIDSCFAENALGVLGDGDVIYNATSHMGWSFDFMLKSSFRQSNVDIAVVNGLLIHVRSKLCI